MKLFVVAVFSTIFQISILTSISLAEEDIKIGSFIGKLYEDGSGIFGNQEDVADFKDVWSITVAIDKITDKTIIRGERDAFNMTKEYGKIRLKTDISLGLNFSDKNSEYICVNGHDFPDMTAFIRVDKNKPITTNKNGCTKLTSTLDKQLRSGNKVTLRGYVWPYRGAEDQEFELSGYAELTDFFREKRAFMSNKR